MSLFNASFETSSSVHYNRNVNLGGDIVFARSTTAKSEQEMHRIHIDNYMEARLSKFGFNLARGIAWFSSTMWGPKTDLGVKMVT